ncbi:glycosyltransferase [Neolewinella marina]|nr:glycosyltransferase [Neolewinella marina]
MNRAGVETMIMNLYRCMDRSRLLFDFLYFSNDQFDYDEEIRQLGGRIHRLREPKNLLDRLKLSKSFLTSHHQYSAIHVHDLYHSGLYLLAAWMSGTKIRVMHAHVTRPNLRLSPLARLYQGLTIGLARRLATGRIACGRAAGQFLYGNSTPFTVMKNGIALQEFEPPPLHRKSEIRKSIGVSDTATLLCQVGRLEQQKNPLYSLEVLHSLRLQGKEVMLIYAGEGRLRPAIIERARELGLTGHVRLLGSRQDTPDLMFASDHLLLPSYYEGFPLVIVESQAMGLSSIVSDRVSPEIDLNLGLVRFIGLESPARWASTILENSATRKVGTTARHQILREAGYDAGQNLGQLYGLYRVNP